MTSNNAWSKLLEENGELIDHCLVQTYVVCCKNKDTLNQFLSQCWQLEDAKKTTNLEPLGYFTKVITNEDETIRLNIYYAKSSLEQQTMTYLKVFFNEVETAQIRWIFLLDWLVDDKRLWLRQLCQSMSAIQDEDIKRYQVSSVVVMLNSSHILQLERNTMVWNSRRLDLMHQSIRSVCLNYGASLLTLDYDKINKDDIAQIRNLIMGREYTKGIEMLSLHNLFIPYGTDSAGKICTIAADFPVSSVTDEEFIAGTFETTIAASKIINRPSTVSSSEDSNDDRAISRDSKNESRPTHWEFNLQNKLSALSKVLDDNNKLSSATHHRFHKPKTEDYCYEFQLPTKNEAIQNLIRSGMVESSQNDVSE
ncbi:dynein light intermediate chain Ecym_5647 [Eremothecium cymbalariae DBVPG|uniref:Uncharacterized protein n=1 Tax=Eremothecium cymbalariae (strain CBS 270.75 / DBVPG 7215 / KCTC 17166 / NRRL Y-17582) TaxID=931890 RepID=I6NE90_ERECY|nr:hypothetical protein Ecym_5647 [Eremothecium cymbalariae DBVPG\